MLKDLLRKLFGKGRAQESTIDYSRHDPAARERLMARIRQRGDLQDPETPRPLVTLEAFFEGNDDYASIGFNLTPPPSPRAVYDLFRAIREKPDVYDVMVMVAGQEETDRWPWADTVWVITSASAEAVKGWLGEQFQADDLILGFGQDSRNVEPYALPEGMNAIGVWWD